MPRIGIILCDHFPAEVRDVAGGDIGDLYRRLLGGAEPALEFCEYDATEDALPDLEECDGWILTGSRADAHGDEPWVRALLEWIRAAAATRARLAGVCFGHQAIAQALGGRVERADKWIVGPQTLTVEATPWFDAATVELNAMHRDVVTALPPGATTLGRGTTAAVPAFALDDRILCVQDHPEFDAGVTEFLIRSRRDAFGDDVADSGLVRVRTVPSDGPVVGRWLVDFLLDRRR